MKRLLRGSVVLAVAALFTSCSGDPTSDFRNPEGITANPTSVFVNVGETKPVVVSLVDNQGNQIAADYTLSDVGPGITVAHDTAFQHTNTGTPIANQQRFQVTGTAIANSSFKLTASGVSQVIPVRVTPATVDLGISNPTPAWGDTITLTAPAGALFTDTAKVTFAGGPPGDVVSVSPDRTTLRVIPGPNTTGTVTIAHTTVAFDPTLDFTITSVGTVTTPTLTVVEGAISNQTPALGETVTLTLPAGIKVVPESVLATGGFIIPGAVPPRDIVVSTDSSTISFVPAPNADSTIQINGVVPGVLPQFPQILSTTLKVTTPVIDTIPSSVSSATPGAGIPVTLTSTNPGITFDLGSQVLVGGSPAVNVTAAGTTITFVPIPGSTGAVTVTGALAAGFRLDLPTTAGTVTATNAAVAATPGTGAPGTAPTIPTPAAGEWTGKVDGAPFGYTTCGDEGVPCQVYKFVVAADGVFDFQLQWSNTSDLGLYFLASDGTTDIGVGDCDANGNGAGNQPEACSVELVAGTYYLAVVPFGPFYSPPDPNPNWVAIRITQE